MRIAVLGSLIATAAAAGTGGVAIVNSSIGSDSDFINSIGIIRFGRAAFTAARIVIDYKTNCYYRKLPDDPEEVDKVWSQVHLRSAENLLRLCRSNRGVFIKVGQHLGAMEYLLPPEYINTLKVLHSQAPNSSLEEVFRVIKEDLKSDKDAIFKEFACEPLGAASLAQVYKAKLYNGETVAVKVQHPNVRAHSNVDIITMDFLTKCAAKVFPDFKLAWLAEETKKNLPKELDFLHEAENAEKMSTFMKHFEWLRIPKVYWKYSSTRVLTMEYCEGAQVNDLNYMLQNKISPYEVVSKLGEMYSEMIFIHGNVHCDPHPGNIFVRKDNNGKLELCLLDHGLYATLPSDFRYNYSQFWLSLINADVNGIKHYSKELGVGELYGLFACIVTARSWESISSAEGIAGRKFTAAEEHKIKTQIPSLLPQISQILERVPREMILILKTNDLLRGVEHTLKTHKTMKSFTTMSKCCVKGVYHERIRRCQTFYCTFRNSIVQQFVIFKIRTYEIFLWIKSLFGSQEWS